MEYFHVVPVVKEFDEMQCVGKKPSSSITHVHQLPVSTVGIPTLLNGHLRLYS